jgi:hypothetical protein
MDEPLPFVDRHEIAIAAPPDAVWTRLWASFTRPGSVTDAIFAPRETVRPERLRLGGQHRFATYELLFELEPAGASTRLRATTHARFRAGLGRVYRALVIGSGGHALVVKRMLRRLRRAAEADV